MTDAAERPTRVPGLRHLADGDATRGGPTGGGGGGGPAPTPEPDQRVVLVHRIGAVVVALVIAVFGVLGFAGGLAFFDTTGAPVLGMSTNGALSTISVVTAVVLIAAAIRGGRLASTVMIVVGALFLVSAFVNLALLETSLNLLAFRLPNVFFSIGAGLVLLVLGAYGRVSGKLPADNPYRLERGDTDEVPTEDPGLPDDAADAAPDAAMAEAERAVATGGGTDEQRRRVEAVSAVRGQEERRARWRRFDEES